MEVLQVTVTIDGKDGARALARSAVEARLAACAQVFGPIHSTYWWQGAVESAQEWGVLFKTTPQRYAALEAHLREHHPYDVPEIVCTPLTGGNPDYLTWVGESVAG
jgi:periplasmic divalent cation tolerance protein